MRENLKIIVAHPGQQHSYQLAEAVKKKGCLYRYITTYYSFQNKRGVIGIPLLRGLASRASRRRCEALNDVEVKTFGTMGFLAVAFLLRADKKGNLYRRANEWLANWFGKKVAQYAISNHVDAVVMYDTNAERCFSILKEKAPQILRIQDVSAINRLYMKSVYEKDMERTPEFAEQLMAERGFVFEKYYQQIWKNEIRLTDCFIVPSEIVKTSLVFSGVEEKRIYKCPYGAYFKVYKKQRDVNKRLEILYVGNVTQMKGISYLLEAAAALPEEQFRLTVVGKYDCNSKIYKKFKDKVRFAGYVMHEEVKTYLNAADVFVFPSLGDSFGLAVLEAMSFGLPIICSDHAGAADAIRDGINGFVVPAGSAEAIKEKLLYCYEHAEFMKHAREEAYNTAEVYSWKQYQNDVGIMLEQLFDDRVVAR